MDDLAGAGEGGVGDGVEDRVVLAGAAGHRVSQSLVLALAAVLVLASSQAKVQHQSCTTVWVILHEMSTYHF